MTLKLVLGASVRTCVSGGLKENAAALLSGTPAVVSGSVLLGPHEIFRHGRIPDSELRAITGKFDVPAKALKFFDRPSALAFDCLSRLGHYLTVPSTDTALFVAMGPTNASLEVFTNWSLTRGEFDPFPSMMASETVKLLPNVIMSNLSMNLGLGGENALFCGWAQAGAAALESAVEVLGGPGASLAAVVSVSTPLEYFNVDAYRRFMPFGVGDSLLIDAASAMVLAPAGFREWPAGTSPVGAILAIRRFRSATPIDPGSPSATVLEAAGYPASGNGFSSVATQPGRFGETLSAAEPLGCIAVMTSLRGRGPMARGVSITFDSFGNGSSVEVAGPDFVESLEAKETRGRYGPGAV